MLREYPANGNPPVVFLTGATGFLGGAFAARLLENGFHGRLICLIRGDDQKAAEERFRNSVHRFGIRVHHRLPAGVEVLRGDLLSAAWHAEPVLNEVTHTLHLAANTSFGSNPGIRKTNVEGALSVAKAMHGRPLKRYVHVGTATICGAHPPHIVHEDSFPADGVRHLVDYTRSKAEAERLLAERFADLPLVVARPSIVVGHTRLGCRPSGSIFWVLRAVEALRFITWDPNNRIDVVPVDWAAEALSHLLFAPHLRHKRYHISAGTHSAMRWKHLEAAYAELCGGPARDRYEVGKLSELTAYRVQKAVGHGHPRHLLHALELYYRFCSLDLVFDNHRLLHEGVAPPPRFVDYMQVCLESSKCSVYEQMRVDLSPQNVLA